MLLVEDDIALGEIGTEEIKSDPDAGASPAERGRGWLSEPFWPDVNNALPNPACLQKFLPLKSSKAS
jgi:hypothetical protein